MASLRVPDTGLQLDASGTAGTVPPNQAFAVTLSDNVIEDMIKCVQNGEDIQLSLGSTPTFFYGSQSHTPTRSTESYPVDLFLTKPFESTKQAFRIPSTTSLWQKPSSPRSDTNEHNGRPRNVTSSSASSAMDSDIETLQNSLAAAEKSKKHTNILESLPKNVAKSGPKGRYLSSVSSYGNRNGSRPASPALTAVGSPSLNQGYGASQKSLDKAKGQRTMIVHELAADDQSTEYLRAKWSGQPEDFQATLDKVAAYNSQTDKWSLNKLYWKELDVWAYKYDSDQDRQQAIDKAIKVFDKSRLGIEEPQWEKLNRPEDRGKGITLSKVQANIAKGPAAPAPKIKVQKADDAASDAGGEDALKVEGGESMARSSSQPLPAKKKPVNRLLSTKPKASTSKPNTPRALPAKTAKDKPAPAKSGKFLSEEFIMDSDSDSSEKPMSTTAARVKKTSPAPAPAPKSKDRPLPAPKPKQKAKPVERPAERPAERPVEREPARPAKPARSPQPIKRRREDDVEESESSSSSGRPLAKRIKPKTREEERAPAKAHANIKQRNAAADSQSSRNSNSNSNGSLSFKSTKNTSPVKSSPLASSPPTNASDLEQQRRHPPPDPTVRKRKVPTDVSDDGTSSRASTTSSDGSSIVAGKRRRALDPDLIQKAHHFKRYYEKYANLHREISNMDHPAKSQIESLTNMRNKLARLKEEIYRDCPPTISVS